jgi:hypothetical protein
MLGRAAALPEVVPQLRRYLLQYPAAELEDADSYFYWEKLAFGLRPTIRVNHAVIYRGRTQGRGFGAVAIKQLYATHYFYTALDLSVCLDDGAATSPHGFYLLTLKGSQQEDSPASRADAAQGRRRQDALIARKRARLHQSSIAEPLTPSVTSPGSPRLLARSGSSAALQSRS